MGRNDTDYRRRVAIDVYYVRNQTLSLDVYILAKTVRVVLAGDGAY
jgi:lipopolysaccharide/colanic/teichoic acid biosynthesis glycosyltransferase